MKGTGDFGGTIEGGEMSAVDENEVRAQQISQRSCDCVDRKDHILGAPNNQSRNATCSECLAEEVSSN